MDKLPVELIHAILIHTDIGADLVELARVSQNFARVLDGDVAFALAHIRHHLQLPRDKVDHTLPLKQLPSDFPARVQWNMLVKERASNMVAQLKRLKHGHQLPFAYKEALFSLATQTGNYKLYPFDAATSLRIVPSRCLITSTALKQQEALNILTKSGHVAALGYVLSRYSSSFDAQSLANALNEACDAGHKDTVLLLMGKGIPSLDRALSSAAREGWFDCVKAILSDPLQRTSCDGRDDALYRVTLNNNVPIAALLMQYGVSSNALNRSLHHATTSQMTDLVSLLLQQPNIDPSCDKSACLEESVYHSDCSITKLLLRQERVSIASNDYRPIRMALDWGKADHLALFMEVAVRLHDVQAVQIVERYLNTAETSDFTKKVRDLVEATNGTREVSYQTHVYFWIQKAFNTILSFV
ncbi:hypothetical protein HDU78_011117 [Chytriomyces hyalinus]|nr:hypothetical protein HDU78_011117 [Chytriomyces hyalinus]